MALKLNIQDKFNKELPADPKTENSRRQVTEACFSFVAPKKTSQAQLMHYSPEMLKELGLSEEDAKSDAFINVFTGNEVLPNTKPYAMCYGGHQFGNWAGQLGDGRAVLLGEGKGRDLQLKGSGRTPYSRGGDGRAWLGPVLREYVVSEAMHALNIPTTRALAAVSTGAPVARDGMARPGAVLTRIAASHIRVGTFQYFAARGEIDKVQKLANYAIARHYKHLTDEPDRYLKLLTAIVDKQAQLIAKWMLVGFIHGVMNTDNTTISGETIDYGPCAFIDGYDPAAVFSSIDEWGRYAYGKQPNIAQWNLARFAECLLTLIDADESENAVRLATNELNAFPEIYQNHWLDGMRAKLGFMTEEPGDETLVNELYNVMAGQNVDFTLLFRHLGDAVDGNETLILELFDEPSSMVEWLNNWRARLGRDPMKSEARVQAMNKINPQKLLNSKWTAVKPVKKEKHFLVTEVEFDEEGEVIHCLIEAVISTRSDSIDWKALRDESNWKQGWK